MKRVCVFLGSRDGALPAFRDAARGLGQALAAGGFELVYGGASVGLMGALADAALEGGARVTGVIPRSLVDREFLHPGLSAAHVVETMAERKALMVSLADAFVALPGGFGTLDELFEVLTLAQLHLHDKPIGLLDVDGFYAPLVAWVQQALDRGFIPPALRHTLRVASTPQALLAALEAPHQPTPTVL